MHSLGSENSLHESGRAFYHSGVTSDERRHSGVGTVIAHTFHIRCGITESFPFDALCRLSITDVRMVRQKLRHGRSLARQRQIYVFLQVKTKLLFLLFTLRFQGLEKPLAQVQVRALACVKRSETLSRTHPECYLSEF